MLYKAEASETPLTFNGWEPYTNLPGVVPDSSTCTNPRNNNCTTSKYYAYYWLITRFFARTVLPNDRATNSTPLVIYFNTIPSIFSWSIALVKSKCWQYIFLWNWRKNVTMSSGDSSSTTSVDHEPKVKDTKSEINKVEDTAAIVLGFSLPRCTVRLLVIA